jgi:hypothetical protein
MFFCLMMFVWQFVLDLVAVMRMTKDEKDTVSKVKPQAQPNQVGGQKMDQNHAL